MENVLAILLAGGAGERLSPLTLNTAKPAVPFGGIYRIIDFTLSNCINSDIRRILVLTQYKALDLIRHIRDGWTILSPELGEYIEVLPPMKRIHEDWYLGTADACFQNIQTIAVEAPEHCLILAGDHIYKMNYRSLLDFHLETGALATIGVLRRRRTEAARQFGVMQVDTENRVIGFEEKPADPKPIPGDDEHCMASMGIYVFSARFLFEELCKDATRRGSRHDFGGDIIPSILHTGKVFAYPFQDENRKKDLYWRDVGTLDAYYEANLDLVSVDPELNMYDSEWPIRTYQPNLPPPKFVFAEERRRGYALDSIVCPGTIVSGGRVERSILGPQVRINSFAQVEDSILFAGVNIGRHARVRRAIIDKAVHIPAGVEIGFDAKLDLARGFTVTDSGVTVIAKADGVERFWESERVTV